MEATQAQILLAVIIKNKILVESKKEVQDYTTIKTDLGLLLKKSKITEDQFNELTALIPIEK